MGRFGERNGKVLKIDEGGVKVENARVGGSGAPSPQLMVTPLQICYGCYRFHVPCSMNGAHSLSLKLSFLITI